MLTLSILQRRNEVKYNLRRETTVHHNKQGAHVVTHLCPSILKYHPERPHPWRVRLHELEGRAVLFIYVTLHHDQVALRRSVS
jgi:hypothetical protein